MGGIRYSEFVQAVRRYRPSDLIPAIAQHSAERPLEQTFTDEWRARPPWALAAMARESILYGTESRSARATSATLDELFNLFSRLSDPHEEPTAHTILTSITHEQFPYQESMFEEVARAQALFGHPVAGVDPFPWEEVIGVPLEAAIGASLVVAALTGAQQGRFDPAWFDQDGVDGVFGRFMPKDTLLAGAAYLTCTLASARKAGLPPDGLPWSARRFAYNPLTSTPLVDLGAAGTWAPLSTAVARSVTPANLYYAGMASGRSGFGKDLGLRVQAYVGRQLRDIENLEILPEVVYGRRGGEDSADWFIIADEAVVIVEAKSARMSLAAKGADSSLPGHVARSIGRGREQIDTTARLIREKHPAFSRIPSDRRMVGLVVTSEPFYMANSGLPAYGAHGEIQTLVASLRDIELIAAVPGQQLVPALLDVMDDPEQSAWSLFSSLQPRFPEPRRNKVLDAAWSEFSWIGDKFYEMTGAERPEVTSR